MKFWPMAPTYLNDPRWRARSTKNVNYVIRVIDSAEIRIENREERTTRMAPMPFQILVDNPALIAFVVRGLMDTLADISVNMRALSLAQCAVRQYLDRLCRGEDGSPAGDFGLPTTKFGFGRQYRIGVEHVRRYVHEVRASGH